jgi:hypothetical protein
MIGPGLRGAWDEAGGFTQRHALSRLSQTKADEAEKVFGVRL